MSHPFTVENNNNKKTNNQYPPLFFFLPSSFHRAPPLQLLYRHQCHYQLHRGPSVTPTIATTSRLNYHQPISS